MSWRKSVTLWKKVECERRLSLMIDPFFCYLPSFSLSCPLISPFLSGTLSITCNSRTEKESTLLAHNFSDDFFFIHASDGNSLFTTILFTMSVFFSRMSSMATWLNTSQFILFLLNFICVTAFAAALVVFSF